MNLTKSINLFESESVLETALYSSDFMIWIAFKNKINTYYSLSLDRWRIKNAVKL